MQLRSDGRVISLRAAPLTCLPLAIPGDMALELEENLHSTEEEDEEEEEEEGDEMRSRSTRNKGGAASSSGNKKKKKKKNQPGRYSQLVVDTIRKLGERNGSSLAKIYSEAKKVSWFDQQNGRTYLKYSIKALVQNDTLLQVKGVGANGSFRLNKKKLEGLPYDKKPPPAKPSSSSSNKKQQQGPSSSPSKSHKKAKPKAKAEKEKPKTSSAKAKSPKKSAAKGKKMKKGAKPSVRKAPKSKKA